MPELDMNPDSKKAAWALLRDYNSIAVQLGLPEVKKFSDRATGLKRLTAMRQKLAGWNSLSNSTPETQLNNDTDTAVIENEAAVDEAAVDAAAAAPASRRGRSKKICGVRLYATSKCTERNPRREGTNGYRSLQIIIDNPGILAEDYFAQGGRTNDLQWDIAHGNAYSTENVG